MYAGPVVYCEILENMQVYQVPPGHGASTAEAACGTVRIGEHDEEVADRAVDLIARVYEHVGINSQAYI